MKRKRLRNRIELLMDQEQRTMVKRGRTGSSNSGDSVDHHVTDPASLLRVSSDRRARTRRPNDRTTMLMAQSMAVMLIVAMPVRHTTLIPDLEQRIRSQVRNQSARIESRVHGDHDPDPSPTLGHQRHQK